MIKCIICLDKKSQNYLNMCEVCNNFIICNNCHSNNNIHNIDVCPHCRTKLTKKFVYSYNTLKIILHYYKFLLIHIIFNIIYSNIFLYYCFPYNHKIYAYFPSTITQLLLINNFVNFMVIPIIYTSFKYYYRTSVMYASVNVIYSMIFYMTDRSNHIQLYYIYYVLYFYIFTLLKYTTFMSYYLLLNFNISKINLFRIHNLYNLIVYNYMDISSVEITSV
jgi:hypothetical protein